MKNFTMPADFKIQSINKYHEINEIYSTAKVIETYGQITEGNLVNSGRNCDSLPQIGLKELERYVDYSIKKNIKFNYTFNASCLSNLECSKNGLKQIGELIDRLWNIGIDTYTVTIPAIMEFIITRHPQANIIVSTICGVNSLSKVQCYKRMGVKRIVVDADISRNINLVKQMNEIFQGGIEIILNNLCYRNCPYKFFHYNHDSHYTADNGGMYFTTRCAMQKYEKKENILKLNWIRPEDIHFYELNKIEIYKLQGRPSVSYGKPWKTVQAYIQEEFAGNLCDLLMLFSPSPYLTYIDNKALNGFLENLCINVGKSEDCKKCNYCKEYAKKSVVDSDFNKQLVKMFKELELFGEEKCI